MPMPMGIPIEITWPCCGHCPPRCEYANRHPAPHTNHIKGTVCVATQTFLLKRKRYVLNEDPNKMGGWEDVE
jgi:hypothetical protein